MGMELHKSQRGNLAVPPRDFLVFAWRPFILAACVSHRVRGVIEINIRLSYFVAGSAESISFPWHCYLTHPFYYFPLEKNMTWVTPASDRGHTVASVKSGRRIAFRGR